MKIITWNCNGAFRNKFSNIIKLGADIYVIQECENPKESLHKEYIEWANNYLWIGDKKHKGVGIFANEKVELRQLKWSNNFKDHSVKYFLACLINNSFQLLAIWTHQNKSPNFGYIGQLWKYLQINKKRLNSSILIGDFNANAIWDEWDRWWNYSDVVKELLEIGVESCYHKYFNEEHGKERQPTFFMHRKLNKPYHIDYCFTSQDIMSKLEKIQIESFDDWKHLSDHTPLTLTFDLSNLKSDI